MKLLRGKGGDNAPCQGKASTAQSPIWKDWSGSSESPSGLWESPHAWPRYSGISASNRRSGEQLDPCFPSLSKSQQTQNVLIPQDPFDQRMTL